MTYPPDVIRAVVETMRYVADVDGGPVLGQWASDVEKYAASSTASCCPVCAEVQCDDDCPLRHYR